MSKYHAISTNTKWQNWANNNDPYDINNEYIDQFSGNKTRNHFYDGGMIPSRQVIISYK